MTISQLKRLMKSFTFLEEEAESGCRCHTCTILIASRLLGLRTRRGVPVARRSDWLSWERPPARDILLRKQERAFAFLSLSTFQNFPPERLDNNHHFHLEKYLNILLASRKTNKQTNKVDLVILTSDAHPLNFSQETV